MNTVQILVIVLFSIGVAVFVISWYIKSQLNALQKNQNDPVLMEWLKEMRSSIEKQSDVLNSQLKNQNTSLADQLNQQREAMSNQTKLIWERLDNASEIIQNVQKHLGGIQEFGKDMKDLSNILKSPKLRGGLGEQFLYEILSNSLPKDLYRTQFKFRDGSICDAIVKTETGFIPIDSKFPMENFKLMLEAETQESRDGFKRTFLKDVKNRVSEISRKYILPEEGTTEQAVMYIPSENVYYELIVHTPEIEAYCKQCNVVMASPNTLSYFLKVILIGYQKHEFDKHASEVLKSIAGVKLEAEKFESDLNVLDGHISRTTNSMNTVKSKYQRLFGKIADVNNLGDATSEAPLLE